MTALEIGNKTPLIREKIMRNHFKKPKKIL